MSRSRMATSYQISDYWNKSIIKKGAFIFILDSKCPDYQSVLNLALQKHFLNIPHLWIIFDTVQDVIKNKLNLAIDSQVYVVENNTSNYLIKTVYRLSNSADYNVKVIGKFGFFNQMLEEFEHPTIVRDRLNLRRIPLATSYVITSNETKNHLRDYRFVHIDGLSKINFILLQVIADWLNATKVDLWQNTWGYANDTMGIYNGMLGDLMTGRADIAGTTAFITESRLKKLDFLVPTTKTRINFIFRAPPLSYTKNIYIKPFSNQLWFFVALTNMAILVPLYLLHHWEHNHGHHQIRTLVDLMMQQVCTLSQNSIIIHVSSLTSSRIAMLFNWICCMFLYYAYCANIVVLLQAASDDIKDLSTLYDSKFHLGAEDLPYNRHYFRNPSGLTYEHYRNLIYENKLVQDGVEKNFFSIEQGMKKVRNEVFAFSTELAKASTLMKATFSESEKCNIRLVDSIFIPSEPYLSVPKHSVYKEILLVGFRRIFEYGLHHRENKIFFNMKPACHDSRIVNYNSIGLVDCNYPFIILLIGICISVMILFVELIRFRMEKQWKVIPK